MNGKRAGSPSLSGFRSRDANFWILVGLTVPLWLLFLAGMIAWDFATNFRRQINAGHRMLKDENGNLTDVV